MTVEELQKDVIERKFRGIRMVISEDSICYDKRKVKKNARELVEAGYLKPNSDREGYDITDLAYSEIIAEDIDLCAKVKIPLPENSNAYQWMEPFTPIHQLTIGEQKTLLEHWDQHEVYAASNRGVLHYRKLSESNVVHVHSLEEWIQIQTDYVSGKRLQSYLSSPALRDHIRTLQNEIRFQEAYRVNLVNAFVWFGFITEEETKLFSINALSVGSGLSRPTPERLDGWAEDMIKYEQAAANLAARREIAATKIQKGIQVCGGTIAFDAQYRHAVCDKLAEDPLPSWEEVYPFLKEGEVK